MTAAVALAALALVHGSPAADRLATDDGKPQRVVCGAGIDLATVDAQDRVAADCETVVRRVLVDPTTAPASQHQTVVEPDSAAAGATVVAAAQVARHTPPAGGATAIGYATSRDAGRTWRSGLLPGVRETGAPGAFVSDPTVAYDAVHATWLVGTLFGTPGVGTGILVSRSRDGLAWSPPVTAASSPVRDLAFDKEWLACDASLASAVRGRCYLAYTDTLSNAIAVIHSDDGGATWSTPVTVPPTSNEEVEGAVPSVLPSGALVVLFSEGDRIRSAVSGDGGATFSATDVRTTDPRRIYIPLRPGALVLPSAETGGDGRVHVAWTEAGAVFVSSSADGLAWTAPLAVRAVPPGRVGFIPALAADPRSGALALTTYGLGGDRVDAYTVTARDGSTWGAPRRLSARTIPASWLARAPLPFLGDYTSTEFAGGRVVPTLTLAAPPAAGARREGLYAASLAP